MKQYLKVAMAVLLIGLTPILISGCAGTETARTGFLKDYSKLQPHPDIGAQQSRRRFCTRSVPERQVCEPEGDKAPRTVDFVSTSNDEP